MKKYEFNDKHFPHIIVRDFFNDFEIKEIWKELEFLTNSRVLLPPAETASATSESGMPLKQNSAVFLDNIYAADRKTSSILSYMKRFWDKKNIETMTNYHQIFKMLPLCNQDNSLLSYYENSDYYKPHFDNAVFTILIHLYKEPKQFTGGDLFLGDDSYIIPNENNRLIIFPSFGIHGVTQIRQNSSTQFNCDGRYTISHFLGIKLI